MGRSGQHCNIGSIVDQNNMGSTGDQSNKKSIVDQSNMESIVEQSKMGSTVDQNYIRGFEIVLACLLDLVFCTTPG